MKNQQCKITCNNMKITWAYNMTFQMVIYLNVLFNCWPTKYMNYHRLSIHPSFERLLVFISIMLQGEKMVKHAKDIRNLQNQRLQLWEANEYDTLINEALIADKNY